MKKIVWVTAYDYFSARIAQAAAVDAILVGDSLGMTVYGMENTRNVTVAMMARHIQAVRKGAPDMHLVLDFPYGSTQDTITAIETAEIFSDAVGGKNFSCKLEGGLEIFSVLMELRARNFAIVGHLGLTPQTITTWELQGNDEKKAEEIFSTLKKFAALGIQNIVLECVPEPVGKKSQKIFSQIQKKNTIIGIGAGRYTNGQVLVFDDVVGRTEKNFTPKFLKRYADTEKISLLAIQKFCDAVREKKFPGEENVY